MKCHACQKKLAGYLDNELNETERQLIERHLSACATCRGELAALETTRLTTSRALQSLAQNAEPSPQAWGHLMTKLGSTSQPHPSQFRPWISRLAPARVQTPPRQGVPTMQKRTILIPAAAVLIILAAFAFYLFKSPTPVSAQQILDRATQSQTLPATGIQHFRIETYNNLQASVGNDAGTWSILDSYLNLETGIFRNVTIDAKTSKVLAANGYDGSYTYTSQVTTSGEPAGDLIIYRYPQDRQNLAIKSSYPQVDPISQNQALFNEFRSNPNVTASKVNWTDSQLVYFLQAEQPVKVLAGGNSVEQNGVVSLVFDENTFALLESQSYFLLNGQKILLTSEDYLADEVLPANTAVAWDMSDLQGVTIVDDPTGEHSDKLPEKSDQANVTQPGQNSYILNEIPASYDKEIAQVSNPPDAYVISYRSSNGDYFVIQPYTGPDDPNLAGASAETYHTASGLAVQFHQPVEDQTGKQVIAALVTDPSGYQFVITSTLTLEQVKAWAEELIHTLG